MDILLARRCREGAIHPISLNFRKGWRCAKTLVCDRRGIWRATVSDRRISADRPSGMSFWGGASGPHRRHEWTGAQDGDYSLQIVGEHMEAHLSSDLCKGFGPKVGGAHPGF